MLTRFADRRCAPFVDEEGNERRCSLGRRDVRAGMTGEEPAIVAEGIPDLQMGRNGKEVLDSRSYFCKAAGTPGVRPQSGI